MDAFNGPYKGDVGATFVPIVTGMSKIGNNRLTRTYRVTNSPLWYESSKNRTYNGISVAKRTSAVSSPRFWGVPDSLRARRYSIRREMSADIRPTQEIDTIAAVATPPGRGGIGLARLSGAAASDVAAPRIQRRRAPEG